MSVKTFTVEETTAAIKALVSAGKNLSRKIETVLVMAVFDSVVNSSPLVANALVGALRASTKRAGIIAFLETYGQLYNKGGKTGFVHFALGKQASIKWTEDYVNLVQEEAQSWESMKPEVEAAELDVVKLVESIIKRSTKEGATVVNADLVPRLTALLAQYTSKKAIEAAQATSAEAVAA
jgi:hypothetical protein